MSRCHLAVGPAAPAQLLVPPPRRLPARRRRAVTRRCAGSALAARASRCSVCSGNKRWVTRSPIRMCCLPASAVSRRSPSIRKATCGSFSARTPESRSCSSSIRSTSWCTQVAPDVIGYQDKAHGMAVDRRGQRLDHRREWRHCDETQPRGQASPDHRRAGTPRGLERGEGTTAVMATGDGRLRSERRCLYRRGACEREPQRHRFR